MFFCVLAQVCIPIGVGYWKVMDKKNQQRKIDEGKSNAHSSPIESCVEVHEPLQLACTTPTDEILSLRATVQHQALEINAMKEDIRQFNVQ